MQHLDQAIRERAYHLWIADGRRDGNADAYWLAAQRDVLSASLADATMTFAAAPPKSETRKDETRAEETKYPAKKAKAATPARKSKRRAA